MNNHDYKDNSECWDYIANILSPSFFGNSRESLAVEIFKKLKYIPNDERQPLVHMIVSLVGQEWVLNYLFDAHPVSEIKTGDLIKISLINDKETQIFKVAGLYPDSHNDILCTGKNPDGTFSSFWLDSQYIIENGKKLVEKIFV